MDKRKNLNLQEKVSVIKMITNKKMTIKEATKFYKCGKTQIYNIIKAKDKIMEKYSSSSKYDACKLKLRQSKYAEINHLVFDWFSCAREKNFVVSGPILQEKAKEIAKLLNVDKFSASNGWLESFRKRHDIQFKVSCDEDIIRNWRNKLKDILCEYSPKDVASIDETALFFKALPVQTLQMKDEKCSQGQFSNERLTVLLLAFGDGKFEIPLVVGKSENPRCFRNLNPAQFSIEWKSNKMAWITSDIVVEFLQKLNWQMETEGRNILLFLDNATCHPKIQLSNIKLMFMPRCKSSGLQPLDNGITQNLKLNYRKFMLQHVISHINTRENASAVAGKINVLDAITFLSHSVEHVNDEFVKRCFVNCGFVFDDANYSELIVCNVNTEIEELVAVMYLQDKREDSSVNAKNFVNIDKHASTEIDEADVANMVQCEDVSNEHESNDDDECEQIEMEEPTSAQVAQHINALKYYAKMKGNYELFDHVVKLGFIFNAMEKD